MHRFTRRAIMATATAFAALPAFAQGTSRIGIIGSGRIGGTVGGLWVKAGHPVLFSSRQPEELKDMVAALGPLAKAGTVADAIAFGDVLFIATPYNALVDMGQTYKDAIAGKVILDACNAVALRDGGGMMADVVKEVDINGIGPTSQKYLSGALVVRAFNSAGVKILAKEAGRPDPKLPVPFAADDAHAAKVAADMIRDAGFEPVLVGPLKDAGKFYYRGGIAGLNGKGDTGEFKDAAEARVRLAVPADLKTP